MTVDPPQKPRPLRRLVPDFSLASDTPRPTPGLFSENLPAAPLFLPEEPAESEGFLRRRWPILAALLLVGGGVTFFLQQTAHRDTSAVAPVADVSPVRPLGLYVDPSSPLWRVSWNDVHGARSVELFVRDAEEQNRIQLTPQDLESGTWHYTPKGQDVTFRLEVTDAAGRLSAESFRVMKPVAKEVPKEEPKAEAQAPPAKSTHPKAVTRVAPIVPASIRPRIRGTMPVDVRVKVDSEGRVVSATPVTKPRQGIDSFLADRAVAAAKQWKFERDSPGLEIIHFSFHK